MQPSTPRSLAERKGFYPECSACKMFTSELIAQVRNGRPLDKVPLENGDLFLGTEMMMRLLGHGKIPPYRLCLTRAKDSSSFNWGGTGHTAQRFGSEYSYDLLMGTFDGAGFVEPGVVYFQLKASNSLQAVGTDVIFDVDLRDYNLWKQEEMPVVLALFDASRREAYWLATQRYFREDVDGQPSKGARPCACTFLERLSLGLRTCRLSCSSAFAGHCLRIRRAHIQTPPLRRATKVFCCD
jgi:hypothetical protein